MVLQPWSFGIETATAGGTPRAEVRLC